MPEDLGFQSFTPAPGAYADRDVYTAKHKVVTTTRQVCSLPLPAAYVEFRPKRFMWQHLYCVVVLAILALAILVVFVGSGQGGEYHTIERALLTKRSQPRPAPHCVPAPMELLDLDRFLLAMVDPLGWPWQPLTRLFPRNRQCQSPK